MKLRLDEMVPVRVARGLRDAGFDVDAVVEHSELRGLSDAEQLERAGADDRALVSYDAGDLVPLAAQRSASGKGHAGVILLRSTRFPQGDPQRLIDGLCAFISAPAAQSEVVHWLQPAHSADQS